MPASQPAPADLAANHNGEVIAIAVIFTLLSTLALIARLVSRFITKTGYGADDFLLIAAWIIATAESIAIAAATHFAKLGYHLPALSTDNAVALVKLTYATSFLQSTTLALAKLSILVLFHRIFIVPRFRLTVYILSGIVIAWWLAAFFGGAFICYPANRLWQPDSIGSCGNQFLLNVIEPIPWVLTDFAILIAPIPVVRKLQLSKAQRWRIYAVFGLGGITCIISVIRYAELLAVRQDVSWTGTGISCLQIVEAHVSIACSALIAAKPSLSRLFPEKWRQQFRSKGSSNPSALKLPAFKAEKNVHGDSSSEGEYPVQDHHQAPVPPRIMVERSIERKEETYELP